MSKTYDHVQIKADAMEDEGCSGKLKGVLIFASQIEIRPGERDPFLLLRLQLLVKMTLQFFRLRRCFVAMKPI